MNTLASKPLIYDFDLNRLAQTLKSWDEPDYRASQIWLGLYQSFWDQPDQFTNLSKSLRDKLADTFSFSHLKESALVESADGETRKVLFYLPDGHALEAVLMRYRKRRTLCISTQSGCAMGCAFCATGQMGFRRHLSSGEIVEQVLYYARLLSANNEQLTNVVMMGMGEPFHNYEATMQAIDCLNHRNGFNLGARRLTISTVGLVPAIHRFTKENRQVNLAISLHAADDQLRTKLIPVNNRYPLDELLQACQNYVETTRRRISFEWALIQNVNDSLDQAKKLAKRLQVFRRPGSTLCHVNVIPLNPTQQYPGRATSHHQALVFKSTLESAGIPCTIRLRRGIDIQAGCGQLAFQADA